MAKKKLKKFKAELSINEAVKILKRLSEVDGATEAVDIYLEEIISEKDLSKITDGRKLLMIEPTNQDILLAIADLLEN